jgi:hypothetical protein
MQFFMYSISKSHSVQTTYSKLSGNLEGISRESRGNLKGISRESRGNLEGISKESRRNLEGISKESRRNLEGISRESRRNLGDLEGISVECHSVPIWLHNFHSKVVGIIHIDNSGLKLSISFISTTQWRLVRRAQSCCFE